MFLLEFRTCTTGKLNSEEWKITDIIGRGGYGEVYKAQAGDNTIAVKVENTKRKRQVSMT